MSPPSVHPVESLDSSDVPMEIDETLQGVTTNSSQIALVISSLKKKIDDDHTAYSNKRMFENGTNMANIASKHLSLAVKRGNSGAAIGNGNGRVNLLRQRMQEAVAKRNGALLPNSPVVVLYPRGRYN